MSSGSFKDTAKALHATFAAREIPDGLPVELLVAIEAFLESHQPIDDHDSQRIHEELLSIHKKYVADTPEKHAAFISALQRLQPAIRGNERLSEWWSLVIEPTINAVGHKRDEVEEAREFLLGAMIFDSDEDEDGERAEVSERFCSRLLETYLSRTRIPSAGSAPASPVDEFVAHEVESILVSFGRRRPRELLQALNDLFVQAEHRPQILGLLSAFVRTQPPHLYYVLETPLIENLIVCLLVDTSTTVIELALTVLIMFLPHITNSVKPHLPRLFLVYNRILCWDLLLDKQAALDDMQSVVCGLEAFVGQCASDMSGDTQPWQKFDANIPNSQFSNPPLVHYFTFLYGLFPLNFLSFIRKSRKWLKSVNFPHADDLDLDQSIIHRRSQEYQKAHLLHPNFYLTTQEDELNDNRWLNSDPADVVTDCMGLCVAVKSGLRDPGPPPTSKLPQPPTGSVLSTDAASGTMVADEETIPSPVRFNSVDMQGKDKAHLDGLSAWQSIHGTLNSRNNSQSSLSKTTTKSSTGASPLLKPHDTSYETPKLTPLEDPQILQPLTYEAHLSIDSGTLAPDEKESIEKLETFAQTLSSGRPRKPSTLSEEHTSQSLASLQTEIMLLRNDLNFERYLKHQHLAHIGQLQRKNLKEATAEAQTQNLINTNRTLKAKLVKSDELNERLKKETSTFRGQSRKAEDQIRIQLRALKEEQKVWKADGEALRLELLRLQEDCSHLKEMVDQSDARELHTRRQLEALQSDLIELHSLRREVMKQKEALHEYRYREQDPHATGEEQQQLRNELESVNMKLASRDKERERTLQAYERTIADLESRLYDNGVPQNPGSLSPAVQQMIDSALAASHGRFQQLKKTHTRLHDRYIELEMRYHELERENQRAQVLPIMTRNPDAPARDSSIHRPASRTASHSRFPYSNPLHQETVSDEEDYFSEYNTNNPPQSLSPFIDNHTNITRGESLRSSRPVRFESLQQQYSQQQPHRSQARPSSQYGPNAITASGNLGAVYEASLDQNFQARSAPSDPMTSSAKSTMSWDSGDTGREKKKDKIVPDSKVRVFGRGGAQNIGKKKEKDKSKDKDKDKSNKSGGFRGLKGIM